MSLETDFNQSPYFDDYKAVAEDKDYHRILFRPGLAVQARELTQIQSLMQEQIARFGDNVYKEGTIIEGCAFQYDANVAFVRLRDRDRGGNTINVSSFANGIVQGLTSGVRAKVLAVATGSEASTPDTNVLMVRYIDSGTSKTNKTFALNETLSYLVADGGACQLANTLPSNSFGFGSLFAIGAGIIYGKGHFVKVRGQNVILEKFSTTPSYKLGFKITESIVDSDADQTLLDNARGAYNYTAPGANRLKLTANLVKRVPNTANTETFTTLFEVEEGMVKLIRPDTIYDELNRQMANRTFEESGNYFVEQMNTAVKEHLDTTTNFGRYTAAEGGNRNKLAIGIEPGVAYVMGYRNEVLNTEWITADKATSTKQESGVTVTTNYGNYVDTTEVVGPWDPTTYQSVSLRNAKATAIQNGTFGLTGAPGQEVGTAKIKFVDYVSGTAGTTSGKYRFYLFDVQMSNSEFTAVQSLYANNATGPSSFADIANTTPTLQEASFNRNIYDTGLKAVQQLTNSSNTVNTTYAYRDKASLTFSTGGTATLSMSGAHAGGTEELNYGVGSLNDAQKAEFQVVLNSDAETSNFSQTVSGSDASATITTSSSLEALLSPGDFVKVNDGSDSSLLKVVTVSSGDITVSPNPDIGSFSGANIFKVYPSGSIIDMQVNGVNAGTPAERTITVASSVSATLDIKESLAAGVTATVFFNAKRENTAGSSKLVRRNRFVKLDLNTNVAGTNGPWILGFADVLKIRNVYIGSSYSITNRNVTSEFRLIKNSNDNLYAKSKLALSEASNLNLSSGDRLLVELDYFEHSRSGGIGFFSVDSYPIDPNESTSNTTAIATPEIPLYESTSAGSTYNLRNSIDFRPREVTTANDAISVSTATTNPISNTALDLDSDGSYVPVVNKNFTSDMMFYLPRRDRVVIGKDGKKKVIQGIPSQDPITPEEPGETMTLATLDVPAFPSLSLENAYNFDRVDLAVRVKPSSLKRFRMRDIKAIEERVDRLEYYTSLNVLEKSAADLKISDSTGLDRFKNGIFVDSFFGHDNSDLIDPSYKSSIDTRKGELRPSFEVQNIDLSHTLGSNTTRKGNHVRLDLSSVSAGDDAYVVGDTVYVGSSLGSATARGTVRHIAPRTSASSTKRIYLHEVTGSFTASTTLNNNNRSGTANIFSVQNARLGGLATIKYDHKSYVEQPYASLKINPVNDLMYNWVGNMSLSPDVDHWVDTTFAPDVTVRKDNMSSWQRALTSWNSTWGEWDRINVDVERVASDPFGWSPIVNVVTAPIAEEIKNGIRVGSYPFADTQAKAGTMTRTDIVPFMRSRVITVSATGMKPNTRVYAFFDGINVTDNCSPSTLTTDSNGSITLTFNLPSNSNTKFRTGSREFLLTDISNLTTSEGSQTTSARATYTAVGTTRHIEGSEVSTAISQTVIDTIRNATAAASSGSKISNVRETLAQTFTVGNFEFADLDVRENIFGIGADGVFVSAIDLYFAAKSSTAGVSVEIREMENGRLTAKRVPFAHKRVNSADVNEDATLARYATPFYFDSPVYLRGNKQYAIVVKPDGNNPDYRLWTAELGSTDVNGGERITQQPAIGQLLTASNDKTNAPRVNYNIKFSLWRSQFDTSVTGSVTYTNEADEYLQVKQISGRYQTGENLNGESLINMTSFTGNTVPLQVNDKVSFGSNTGIIRKIINNSSTALFKADMFGSFPNGATLTFTTASGSFTGVSNTLTANVITGEVQFFDPATGVLIANNSGGNYTANTTLLNGFYRGQTSNATSQAINIRDFKYNVLVPKLSFVKYVDTGVNWSTKTTSNSYSISSSFSNIEALKDNVFVDGEKLVAGKTSENDNTSGSKTLTVKADIFTNVDRISPVVDVSRSRSALLVHNIINDDNSGEHGNYGNAKARYISKKVVLADGQEAEDLRVILTAYKPQGTEVDVYARFQNEEDSDQFSDKHYTKLTQSTNTLRFSSPTVADDYVEYEFQVPTSNATLLSAYTDSANNNILRYNNSAGATFRGYKSFSLKIVMRATGTNIVPKVKDLRAIALQV